VLGRGSITKGVGFVSNEASTKVTEQLVHTGALQTLAKGDKLTVTVERIDGGKDRSMNLEAKQTGERSAGNPHAVFDEAGAGNVAWSRWCDTRKRKGEITGNTNFDLHRRASSRPYR
jgi:hypothetical protein